MLQLLIKVYNQIANDVVQTLVINGVILLILGTFLLLIGHDFELLVQNVLQHLIIVDDISKGADRVSKPLFDYMSCVLVVLR